MKARVGTAEASMNARSRFMLSDHCVTTCLASDSIARSILENLLCVIDICYTEVEQRVGVARLLGAACVLNDGPFAASYIR